ncbi:hypothetical protein HK097_011653 [Rhizophlyctis rosea]|uniref:Endo-beta-1,6-galactanase-like domain-containing protein n=1 Tax=Rhizophlyctis rosea TaxID=64517 RepID=A0AAD5S625_9FUNG|nr:hypothetical protein HK097_011653 [Rhizophlyctis rosea]
MSFADQFQTAWDRIVTASGLFTFRPNPNRNTYTFRGFGTSLAWWAHIIGGWSPQNMDRTVRLLYAPPPEGLGFTVCRYNIGGGDDPNCPCNSALGVSHLRAGGNVPGYKSSSVSTLDANADPTQLLVLKQCISHGATILEAFANSPPYYMCKSGCVSGAPPAKFFQQSNLKAEKVEEFATYLVDVLIALKDIHGVDIDFVAPVNEPHTFLGSWTQGGWQEGCSMGPKLQGKVISALHKELKQRGLYTKIAIPDEVNTVYTLLTYLLLPPSTHPSIHKINTHTYAAPLRPLLHLLSTFTKTPLWMSEIGVPGTVRHSHTSIQPALDLATHLIKDLTALKPEVWCYWQAVEDENIMTTINDSNWGLVHARFDGAEEWWVTKQYWGMMCFSGIRPGSEICADGMVNGLGGILGVVAFVEEGEVTVEDGRVRRRGKVVFVGVNRRERERKVKVDLKRFVQVEEVVRMSLRRTSETEDYVEVMSGEAVFPEVEVILPARSIARVTFSGLGVLQKQKPVASSRS